MSHDTRVLLLIQCIGRILVRGMLFMGNLPAGTCDGPSPAQPRTWHRHTGSRHPFVTLRTDTPTLGITEEEGTQRHPYGRSGKSVTLPRHLWHIEVCLPRQPCRSAEFNDSFATEHTARACTLLSILDLFDFGYAPCALPGRPYAKTTGPD